MLKFYIVGLPPTRVQREFRSIQDVSRHNGDGQTPFHISLIYPFNPKDPGRVESGIDRVADVIEPIQVTLGGCRILRGGKYAVCLMAEPRLPFQNLVRQLSGVTGISQPHPEYNPHATVALLDHEADAKETLSIVEREIRREKPKTSFQLGAITLLWWEERQKRWDILRTFPLRGKG